MGSNRKVGQSGNTLLKLNIPKSKFDNVFLILGRSIVYVYKI